MKRITREELRIKISVALAVQKRSTKRVVGVDVEDLRHRLADELTALVLGRPDNEAVLLIPSRVLAEMHDRPGRWDEDEPHPRTYLPIDG